MSWRATQNQPITGERDLSDVEEVVDGTTPVNAKLHQIPRLIGALRRAWASNGRLKRELRQLRSQHSDQETRAA